MRKLILVPMIHMGADHGKATGEISLVKNRLLSKKRIEHHEKTISLFWDNIRNYFQERDVKNMKIFQDGLAAEGEIGKKIVKELALKGSKNFMVVSDLIDRGAIAMKTEDIELILQEQSLFLDLLQSKGFFQTLVNYLKYRIYKDRLLKKRDIHMAGRINGNLKKGETAALFIGVAHNVIRYLDKDIHIFPLKDLKMVNDYFKALNGKQNDRKFQYLSDRLISEINGESKP
ncbi:MAG: hypothetical protein A2097_01825 [Desulfobacula sp. GWF2_41_7]|nr:MAG: hypothetical protein A2097_01825 [Desulfobacula sp. GWF2_41_7]